jgi:hypothetical protein
MIFKPNFVCVLAFVGTARHAVNAQSQIVSTVPSQTPSVKPQPSAWDQFVLTRSGSWLAVPPYYTAPPGWFDSNGVIQVGVDGVAPPLSYLRTVRGVVLRAVRPTAIITLPLQAICRTNNGALDLGVVGRLDEGLGPTYPCNYVIPPAPGTTFGPYEAVDNETDSYGYYSSLLGTSNIVSASDWVAVLAASPSQFTYSWMGADAVLNLINNGTFNSTTSGLFYAGNDRWVRTYCVPFILHKLGLQ